MNFKSLISKLFLAGVICSVAACSDDETTSGVEEGLPASLTFTMTLPPADEIMNTRASSTAESSVENIQLFFYKDETSKPVVVPITVGAEKSKGSYNYTTEIPTGTDDSYREYKVTIGENAGLTSGIWKVYGVANYNKNYVNVGGTDLSQLSKSEMDKFLTSGSHELDFVETGVLLSGKYIDYRKGDVGELKLDVGENTINGEPLIVLKRTVAKNVFKFKTEGLDGNVITFTPTSYKVVNHSASATLMERTWKAYPTNTGFGDPGDLVYSGNDLAESNETQIASSSDGSYSFTFYCQENVQKVTNAPSGAWTYNNREDHESANDPSFKYAPKDATYVVVKGTYKDKTYEGTVTYTIHLGDFSEKNNYDYSNFSVRRNVKYTYNVTIKGVGKIETEVYADNEGYPEAQPGAEGNLVTPVTSTTLSVDAHYEQVLLPLGPTGSFKSEETKGALDHNWYLTLLTPYTDGAIKLDLNKKDCTETDWNKADISWIEFGKPASSTTFQAYSYYTATSGEKSLCDVKTLMEELNQINTGDATNYPHLLVGTDSVYVAAYVNEYYYADKATSNANLAKFINADDRVMTLAGEVKFSGDKQSSISKGTLFSISQRSIKTPFSLTALANPFGIETVEETPRAMLSSQAKKWYEDNKSYSDDYYAQYERNNSNMSGTDFSDGWSNTVSTKIAAGGSTIIGQKWSDLVNSAKNGYIGGYLAKGSVMQSAYNYSLYQFLSRNRDLDGDDVIDEEEIRWYVPSELQCLQLWYGMNALPSETQLDLSVKTYLTSTGGTARTWWANEGVSFGYWKATDQNGLNSVRVIRNLGTASSAYKSKSTDIYSYNSSTRTVTISGLADVSMRSTSHSGNYDIHKIQETPDKLYKSFQIASEIYTDEEGNTTFTCSNIATSSTLGTDYSEFDDESDKGQWRIPNEKELGIIFQMISNGSYTNVTLPKTDYTQSLGCRTTTGVSGNNYYKAMSTHITTAYDDKTYKDKEAEVPQRLLLVRDVSTTSSSSAKSHDVSLSSGGKGFGLAKSRKGAKRK